MRVSTHLMSTSDEEGEGHSEGSVQEKKSSEAPWRYARPAHTMSSSEEEEGCGPGVQVPDVSTAERCSAGESFRSNGPEEVEVAKGGDEVYQGPLDSEESEGEENRAATCTEFAVSILDAAIDVMFRNHETRNALDVVAAGNGKGRVF